MNLSLCEKTEVTSLKKKKWFFFPLLLLFWHAGEDKLLSVDVCEYYYDLWRMIFPTNKSWLIDKTWTFTIVIIIIIITITMIHTTVHTCSCRLIPCLSYATIDDLRFWPRLSNTQAASVSCISLGASTLTFDGLGRSPEVPSATYKRQYWADFMIRPLLNAYQWCRARLTRA